MTVSGGKQRTVQVISSPPAPVPRLEKNGKECEQRLDNGNEKGKRVERKKIKGRMRRETGEVEGDFLTTGRWE